MRLKDSPTSHLVNVTVAREVKRLMNRTVAAVVLLCLVAVAAPSRLGQERARRVGKPSSAPTPVAREGSGPQQKFSFAAMSDSTGLLACRPPLAGYSSSALSGISAPSARRTTAVIESNTVSSASTPLSVK